MSMEKGSICLTRITINKYTGQVFYTDKTIPLVRIIEVEAGEERDESFIKLVPEEGGDVVKWAVRGSPENISRRINEIVYGREIP